MIRTSIEESENGHRVSFSIDHQTFYLEQQVSEEGMTSLERAKWYERQLKIAFERLTKPE